MKIRLLGKATTQLDKMKHTRSTTLSIVSAACVVVIFCLVASKTLLSNAAHQRHIITARHNAINQLKDDISSFATLSNQYQAFNANTTNIIGGNSSGKGTSDGPNPQIVLDALPSQYDFPGLTASVESLLADSGVKLQSITGTDDESANVTTPQGNPRPVPMNITFSATTTFGGARVLFANFQKSIRPFQVATLQLSGSDANLTVSANINSFYQPAKTVSITQKGVQ